MKTLAIALALAAALGGTIGAAQEKAAPEEGGIADKIANNPYPDSFQTYGGTPKIVEDDKVQFGKAMRFTVTTANPAEPWGVGMNVPVAKPVEKGDKLIVAFWARAERTEGGAPGKLANVQVQHAAAPYKGLFGKSVEVGPEWAMHQVSGVVDADYPAGGLHATVHLGGAEQVIDMGPVFVLDMGQ